MRAHGHPVVAAVYDPLMWVFDRLQFRPHRHYLVSNLEGVVLDIGCGPGSLFRYLDVDAVAEGAFEYHALEPDPYMRKRAINRAESLGLPVTIRDGRAESLPFRNDSVDIVIASMVFCTVDDPSQSVAEVYRILEPGGEFRFFEHVAADGIIHRMQQGCNPVWSRLAAGCHLDRRTISRIFAHRGFDPIEIERVRAGVPPVYPFVRGTARKRR